MNDRAEMSAHVVMKDRHVAKDLNAPVEKNVQLVMTDQDVTVHLSAPSDYLVANELNQSVRLEKSALNEHLVLKNQNAKLIMKN